MRMNSIVRLLACVTVIVLASGCTSMRALPSADPDSIARYIEPGDRIAIQTFSGNSIEMSVAGIDDLGISGDGSFVRYDEIQRIAVSRYDRCKTSRMLATVVASPAIVFYGLPQYVVDKVEGRK